MISSLIAKVIDKYADIITLYDEISKGYIHWRSKGWSIVNIVRYCGEGILADLGSGHCIQGYTGLKVSNVNYVLCLDISPGMLTKGKNMFQHSNIIDFIATDITSIPLRKKCLKCALVIASLHHLDYRDLVKALYEIRRTMLDRGLVIITTWSPWQLRFLPKLIMNYLLKLLDPLVNPRIILVPWRRRNIKLLRIYFLYTLKELLNLSKMLGFKILSFGYYSPHRRGSINTYLVLLNP